MDRISNKSDSMSKMRSVFGKSVQQALLKILERTIASVSPHGGRKHPQQKYINHRYLQIFFLFVEVFLMDSKV